MQSLDSISRDGANSGVSERCPGTTERSVLHVAPPAPSEEADAVLEGHRPIADPSERLPVEPRSRPKGAAPGRPGRTARFARETLKTAATLLILALASLAALVIWDSYVTAPWTRDGSVRVQVASIAPEVSGQITEVRVVDNQFVHQGDVLYVIDPFDFHGPPAASLSCCLRRALPFRFLLITAYSRPFTGELSVGPELLKQAAVTDLPGP